MNSNPVFILRIDLSKYTLSTEQILNIASEFYGEQLEVIQDSVGPLMEIGFEGKDGQNNADQFEGYLKQSFSKRE
jgi:hypothetical protein